MKWKRMRRFVKRWRVLQKSFYKGRTCEGAAFRLDLILREQRLREKRKFESHHSKVNLSFDLFSKKTHAQIL